MRNRNTAKGGSHKGVGSEDLSMSKGSGSLSTSSSLRQHIRHCELFGKHFDHLHPHAARVLSMEITATSTLR
jgi:hypothetical protein